MNIPAFGLIFLCFGAISAENGVVPADNNNDWDPGTYHLIDGKYYFVDRYTEPISTARYYCSRAGMIPISFEDPAKQAIISEYFINAPGFYANRVFWTNGIKRRGSNEYIWEPSGIPFDDSLWSPGYPLYINDTKESCIRYKPSRANFVDSICDPAVNRLGEMLCEDP
ncbi:uncharacterized protein LOC132193484 [Neocloeon triangulifer]|uniref:uncharacterized protein LOC132193484 n=1 Tax=Neocloeon triangulifer TaxID=2078957 RepID=UPI00286FADC9|nr:uncharacterized protein LOC132193484 [Neocloeon triangulifer]